MTLIRKAARGAALALALGGLCPRPAAASVELIQNGGFESGTFSPWTVTDQSGTDSTFSVRPDGKQNNGVRSTVGPASGSYYAVSDQVIPGNNGGNGATALIQSFIVPNTPGTVILSYDMFVDNYSDTVATPPTLDYTTGGTNDPNQQARVDLLTAGASAFSVAPSDVIQNFYDGSDPNPDGAGFDNPHNYMAYSYDITSLVGAGGTFQLRFAEVNNQDNLYQGVDNVSVLDTPAVSAAPEPSQFAALGAFGLGLGALLLRARRRN